MPAVCQDNGSAETADNEQSSSDQEAELEALLAQLSAMDITPGAAADDARSRLLQDKQAAAKQQFLQCYHQFRAMFYAYVEQGRAALKQGEDPTPLRSGQQLGVRMP
jgi:hypothetical protein